MIEKMKNKKRGKELPYWIKGGIISLIISLILFILVRKIALIFPPADQVIMITLFWPFFILAFTFEGSFFFNQPGTVNFVFGIIILLLAQIIYSFLIGAIIGFIVGKIKNKKRRK